jgi:hypothetical protein
MDLSTGAIALLTVAGFVAGAINAAARWFPSRPWSRSDTLR